MKSRKLQTIVPGKVADRIKQLAEAEGRTESAMQRRLIEEGLRQRALESKKEGT